MNTGIHTAAVASPMLVPCPKLPDPLAADVHVAEPSAGASGVASKMAVFVSAVSDACDPLIAGMWLSRRAA